MPTWLTIAWTLGLLYGIVHGMLMLVSPAKHRKFNLLLNDPFRTIKLRIPESEDGRGLELGYRLGGRSNGRLYRHALGEPSRRDSKSPLRIVAKASRYADK